jgi:DNA end-binding protein Ku
MAGAVWSGVISFGSVAVPVGLYPATEEHRPAFDQFAAGSLDRIRCRRVDERSRAEVDHADIVEGVAVGDGDYVMLTDAELEQVAPGRSRALEITGFVDLDAADPIWFDKTYYLAPGAEENKKTYALLRDAMAATDRAGIAVFVMHGRQHLAAIRAAGDVLVPAALFFADEVGDPRGMLDNLAGRIEFNTGEMAMATQLVESLDQDWKPERYHDRFTERVEELIPAKGKGNEVRSAAQAPAATDVVDLLDSLRRCADAVRGGSGNAPARRTTPRRTSAKRSTTRITAKHAPAEQTTARKTTVKKAPAKKAKAPAKKAPAKKAPAKATASAS